MRVLRCAWPLAGVLLVSLASAEIAWADDRDESTAAAAAVSSKAPGTETGSTFRLLGKTWCLGAQPVTAVCDVTLPQRPAEAQTGERPLERFFAAVRRIFTGSAGETATATGPAERSATSGG
ncbi:MAG TPA: hypothetical protein VFU21_25565 [Kofleriaceae bacterium]|nr:hypothetical protein [Kofleriaceae bacterium]